MQQEHGQKQRQKKKKNTKFNKLMKKTAKKKTKEEISIETIEKKCSGLEKKDSKLLITFNDIPLSSETLKGLEYCEYTVPTDIQRDSLRYSLTGHDVVGAAKTGSGKTLALVIPILECLWKTRWLRSYGLGALIISPTRELALQTFTCINNVGKYHNFSCALLIGGTDVSYERNRLGTVNIIVCTPGRLLQHMDENEHLNADHLQLLVIDEADRILDMGFSKQVNSIVSNLPENRQTLLFSATQTKNVKDLTRVCTKDPVFVSVHENAASATPDELQQSFLVCEEFEKINTLWSFIKMYKQQKMLVFVNSCKQARFITDAFCHLRPGISVMGLWGTMNQTKRISCFQKFENTQSALLIATDVASRGLDFSDVDWVVQMDAPATVEDYIHRVGRTARMNRRGQALSFVTSSQVNGFVQMLMTKNIEIKKLTVDPTAMTDVRSKLQSILAQFSELNQFAQKSVVGYLRSVYLMQNKSIFDVKNIDAAALAYSYGLISVPRIRFLNKKEIKQKENITVTIKEENLTDVEIKEETQSGFADDVDNNEDLFTIRKSNIFNVDDTSTDKLTISTVHDTTKGEKKCATSRIKAAKKLLNKGLTLNRRTIFSDNGEGQAINNLPTANEDVRGLNIEEAKEEMKRADKEDRLRAREKKKLRKELESRKKIRDVDELDLQDDAGSGINSDADLDWLPDPDAIARKYNDGSFEEIDTAEISQPPKKKRKRTNLKQTEEDALALLNPF